MVSKVDFLELLLEHGQQNSAQEIVLPSQLIWHFKTYYKCSINLTGACSVSISKEVINLALRYTKSVASGPLHTMADV